MLITNNKIYCLFLGGQYILQKASLVASERMVLTVMESFTDGLLCDLAFHISQENKLLNLMIRVCSTFPWSSTLLSVSCMTVPVCVGRRVHGDCGTSLSSLLSMV